MRFLYIRGVQGMILKMIFVVLCGQNVSMHCRLVFTSLVQRLRIQRTSSRSGTCCIKQYGHLSGGPHRVNFGNES
jgi:hypothetical protein